MNHGVWDNLATDRGTRRGRHRRRGTILIVTMAVSFTLAGVVLVLCRSMAVEAIASANEAAGVQADAIERGAEQYVLGLLFNNSTQPVMALTDDYFAGIPVGDGFFWILRPGYDDPSLPAFGLVDEASKLDINRATVDQLMMIPGMTDDVAAAIVDWHSGTNAQPQAGGAKDDYYLSLPDPYYCKNAPYETVEELLLVRGVTRQMLYGDGTAPPLGDTSTVMQGDNNLNFNNPNLSRGLYDLFTVNSQARVTNVIGGGGNVGGATSTVTPGRINVNTAPREVLMCIPGLTQADVDAIVAYRGSNLTMDNTTTNWLSTAMGHNPGGDVANAITGSSLRYSADILAVSGNGRAFKRVRIIVDTTTQPMSIIYRRDITERGWPMDTQILTSLRNGTYAGQATGTSGGSHFGSSSSSMGGALR
ncbi:MAG TPA: hypothetical protein VH518_04790 [Tepidisphaeraceae bacterium]|jgi:type II secretory pathway component PulK